jgi:hypothetical protein
MSMPTMTRIRWNWDRMFHHIVSLYPTVYHYLWHFNFICVCALGVRHDEHVGEVDHIENHEILSWSGSQCWRARVT